MWGEGRRGKGGAARWPGASGRVVLSCEVPLANISCGCIRVISFINFSSSGKLALGS